MDIFEMQVRSIKYRIFIFLFLCLFPGRGFSAAQTAQQSLTDYNLWNLYGGASDVYLTLKDGSHKKTKVPLKEYGFLLEFEDKYDKWKVDFSFFQWNDSQLQGEDFSVKLNYLPFKTKKGGIFTRLNPYIGGSLNYHYNKINLPDANPEPTGWVNPYQQAIKGYGAGLQTGMKIKDIPFKGTIWHTELGGIVYTYKSSLLEEEFLSGISFTLDTHFKKRFYYIFLGLGYQLRQSDFDGTYLSDQDKYYPSSQFTHHLFYINLSYPF
ncbi:MAG: hypothetical protein ACMUJM_01020 [bacterium]